MKHYIFPITLIAAIFFGGLTGIYFPASAPLLKPLGDIFLRLILTAIVPLIFCSVTLAIARAKSSGKLSSLMLAMINVFLITGLIASIATLIVVKLFPPALGVQLAILNTQSMVPISIADQLVAMLTVPNFSGLFNHANMLPLIIFSILIGMVVPKDSDNGKFVLQLLQAGEEIMLRLFEMIMLFAPIGFFAYFAVLATELGPKIISTYARVSVLYYLFASLYFVIVYSLYAQLAGGIEQVKTFWKHILVPMLTAIATCSSAASIPANIAATKKMNVANEVVESTIPLGTILHKEGSIIGGMIKIAFLFGLFQLPFGDVYTLATAVMISLLVGTVMGAIPSGGMLGELLILNLYGFPPSALMAIAAISIIIDPLATMLNVTGNSISSVLIGKLLGRSKRSVY